MKKIKKISIVILLVALVGTSLAGCGKNNDDDKLYTVGGEEFVRGDNSFLDNEIGFGVMFPELINELRDKGKIGAAVLGPEGMVFDYGSEAVIEFFESLQSLSDAQLQEKIKEMDKYIVDLFAVLKINTAENSDNSYFEESSKNYNNVEEIGEVDGYKYYFAYNDKFDDAILTEEEKEEVNKIIEKMDEFKNNICIFGDKLKKQKEQEDTAFKNNFKMGEFSANTFKGEVITLDYIKNNELTMINIWTTWCGPCVGEMPELANFAKNMLPEGVKLLSICVDGEDENDIAKEILADAKVEFDVIMPDKNITNGLLKLVDGYPTTIFIDSEGKLVGEKMVGAPYEKVEEHYLNAINERLELISK